MESDLFPSHSFFSIFCSSILTVPAKVIISGLTLHFNFQMELLYLVTGKKKELSKAVS